MKLYFWHDGTSPDGPLFIVTSQKFFDKNQCLDDSGKEEKHVPEGFYRLAESVYEYVGKLEDGKAALLAAGHVEKNMLNLPLQAAAEVSEEEASSSEEYPKKGVKTFNVMMYTIVVSLNGQMEESFSVEGPDTKFSFEKFLNWYLVFRSKKFPNLAYSDIEGVVKSISEVPSSLGEFVVGTLEAVVPVKNEVKETVGQVTLTGTFSKASYGMFL